MRSVVSVLVIAFSVCALAGGFFSGNAAVPRLSLHFPSPNPMASTSAIDVRPIRGLEVPQTDEVALDDFASDPAVVASANGGDIQNESHLAVVIVTCGHSPPLEMPFLSLNIPLAIVIDPDASAAQTLADAAAAAGKTSFVQVAAPLTLSRVQTLRAQFPHASGVAARLQSAPSRDVLRNLREQHLAVLDEYGDANVHKAFRTAGVAYVSRTITVDDHLQSAYVQYMLGQAVHLGRGSKAIVMMRPLPDTLRALQTVIADARSDAVAFDPAVR